MNISTLLVMIIVFGSRVRSLRCWCQWCEEVWRAVPLLRRCRNGQSLVLEAAAAATLTLNHLTALL